MTPLRTKKYIFNINSNELSREVTHKILREISTKREQARMKDKEGATWQAEEQLGVLAESAALNLPENSAQEEEVKPRSVQRVDSNAAVTGEMREDYSVFERPEGKESGFQRQVRIGNWPKNGPHQQTPTRWEPSTASGS